MTTKLIDAIKDKDLDQIKSLVAHGANFNLLQDDENILYCAICSRHLEIVKYFVDECGADVNKPVHLGYPPICWAANELNIPVISFLLDRGADVNGVTPDKSTPLHKAVTTYEYLYAKDQDYQDDVIKFLLDKGANVHAINEDGFTPFTCSNCLCVSTENLLIKAGATCDTRWEWGKLLVAVEDPNPVELVRDLIDQGNNINAQMNSGDTPLYLSLYYGNKDTVKLLIERGANLTLKRKGCENSIELCRRTPGNKSILSLMKKTMSSDDWISTIYLDTGEPWARMLEGDISELPFKIAKEWKKIMVLGAESLSSKPTRSFINKANVIIDNIGEEEFLHSLLRWLPEYIKFREEAVTKDMSSIYYEYYMGDRKWWSTPCNSYVLRGLVWASSRFSTEELAICLRKVAASAFEVLDKDPPRGELGMRNAKIGNSAVFTLSRMNGSVGAIELAALRKEMTYLPALKAINKVAKK